MQRQQLALDVLRLFRGQVELQLVRLPRTLSGQPSSVCLICFMPSGRSMTSAVCKPATLRLLSDLKSISHEPPEGCSASPATEDNLFVWTASIFGPNDTAW